MPAQLLATSPFVQLNPGFHHKRIVLKAQYYGTDHVEYVVNEQLVDENGKVSYDYGDYFPHYKENSVQMSWERFQKRCQELMNQVFNTKDASLSQINNERRFFLAHMNFNITS